METDGSKASERRIYTADEADSIASGIVPGPYKSGWPIDSRIVAEFDGETVTLAVLVGSTPGTDRCMIRLFCSAPDLAASVSHHHRKHQSAVSAIRALILAEQQWDRLRFDADPNVVRGAAAALADAKAALSAEAKP